MTLTRHVAVDTLRRMITIYAIAFAMILLLSVLAKTVLADGEELGTPADALVWSLAAAWFMAFSPAMLLEAREINMLPISRRELWIVRWWLAVVAPPALVGVAVVVAGLAVSQALDLSHLGFVVGFSALYCGCYMALAAVFPVSGPFKPGTWGVVRIVFRFIVIPLGGAALPVGLAKYLPHTLGEIGGPAMNFVIAAAGVTVASYFHRPAITEHLSRRINPSKTSAPTRSFRAGRLSGVTYLAWKEARKSLIVYGLALPLSIAYWQVFGSGSLVEFFNSGSALIFAGLTPSANIGLPGMVLFLLPGASEFALSGEMRSLRALPISARRLAAIITGLNLVTTAMLWFVLLVAHAMVVGTPPLSLRPELFLFIAGMLSIGTVVRLVLPGDPMVKVFAGGLVVGPAFFLFQISAQFDFTTKAGIIAAGPVALVVSWLVITRALRRSQRVYKLRPLVVPISS